jgi:hypothetical protein
MCAKRDHTAIGTRRFLLWRQDDNGNRFLVAAFVSEEAALERMAELTRIPHRQIYWIDSESELSA